MDGQTKADLRSRAGLSRRNFALLAGSAISTLALSSSAFGAQEDVSHSCETIHQVVEFKASRKRVYEVLTDEKLFDKVVKASMAMQSGMSLGSDPTRIAKDVGGTFSLFGGHIVGRHVEIVQGERIVQAWRVATWEAGLYSIARYQLTDESGGCKLVFDHTGFPNGQGQHLAEGWKGNYWAPMEKALA